MPAVARRPGWRRSHDHGRTFPPPIAELAAAATLSDRDDFAICTIDVATGTVTAEGNDCYPAWSTHGDTVVFARDPRAR